MNEALRQDKDELSLNVQDVLARAAHMVCSANITDPTGKHRIIAKSLIDTSASSLFISSNFVKAHKIPTFACDPMPCKIADSSRVLITQQALITQRIGDYTDQTLHYMTHLHNYDTVLGLS
jgi:hypothetical protein